MLQGTVKWFNTKKGYGFLAPDNGGEDVFIHITELPVGTNSLDEGRRVSYDIVNNKGREAASNIKLI